MKVVNVLTHCLEKSKPYDCEWQDALPTMVLQPARTVVDHWVEMYNANGRRVPQKDQIDPLKLGKALSNVYVYVREDAGFLCHLIGEGVSNAFNDRLKGKLLSEILDPSVYGMVNDFMEICIEGPAIYHNYGRLYSDEEKATIVGERVFLPMTQSGDKPDSLIGISVTERYQHTPPAPKRTFSPVHEGADLILSAA